MQVTDQKFVQLAISSIKVSLDTLRTLCNRSKCSNITQGLKKRETWRWASTELEGLLSMDLDLLTSRKSIHRVAFRAPSHPWPANSLAHRLKLKSSTGKLRNKLPTGNLTAKTYRWSRSFTMDKSYSAARRKSRLIICGRFCKPEKALLECPLPP